MPRKVIASKGSGSGSKKRAIEEENEPVTPFEWENKQPDFGIHWVGSRRKEKKRLFDKLKHRTITPSRFADIDTLNSLGIRGTVELLFGRLGLWDLLSNSVYTFRAITLEFLSSFDFDRNLGTVTFQLLGTEFTLTTTELCEKLGMAGHNNFHPMDDFDSEDFCFKIIGHVRTTLKTRQISHPVLRYIQRVLSLTYFGRGETFSNFNQTELRFMWCMLMRNHDEEHYIPAMGSTLADHIMGVIVNPSTTGSISIGGMITKIAYALELQIDDTTAYPVPGPFVLDLQGLVKMHMIVARHHSGPPIAPFYHLTELHARLPMARIQPLIPQDHTTWLASLIPDPDEPQGEMAHDAVPEQQPQQQPPPMYAPQPEYGHILTQMQAMTDLLVNLSVQHTEIRSDIGHLHDRLEDVEDRVEDSYQYSWYTYQMVDRAYRHDYRGSVPLPNAEELPQYQRRSRRPRHHSEEQGGGAPPPPPPQQ